MGRSGEGNTNKIADGLDMECERKKGINDVIRGFGLSNWKDGVAIIEIGKGMYRADLRVVLLVHDFLE